MIPKDPKRHLSKQFFCETEDEMEQMCFSKVNLLSNTTKDFTSNMNSEKNTAYTKIGVSMKHNSGSSVPTIIL